MITFDPDDQQTLFAQTAAAFARDRFRPAARTAERAGAADEALGRDFLELGFGAIDLPEADGGLGLGLGTATIVQEALAFGDLGLTLAMPGPGAFGAALLALGDDDDRRRHLAPLIASGGRGGVAWSESKPKPRTFSTVAVEKADGSFELFGEKAYVLAGRATSAFVVFARMARTNGDVRPGAFVVASDAPGVRFSEPARGLGLLAAPTVTMTLESTPVSAEQRLAAADDRFAEAVVAMWSRIAVIAASRSVGLANAAFTYAKDYAAEREAFGKPVAHFQGLAFLVADMATRVEVMRVMSARAAWAIDRGDDDATKLAAMAAAECHEGAMFVANNAVQVLGGAGYVEDHPAEKWMRDARAHMAYGLPASLADLVVGRRALGERAADLEEDAPMPELQPVLV